MPSPFPGMDPYLEDPAVFPDLHDSLITYARDALNAQLPPPYYAGSAARVWVDLSHRHVGPDVGVLRPGQPTVRLDLVALLDRCYDSGHYDRRVRYGGEPVPPLGPEQLEWARQVLRERGILRPGQQG